MGFTTPTGAGARSRRGRGRTPIAEINVTPMVDVMLVLLIIFMVVTPALMAGFQAEMPTGLNLISKPDDPERTTVGIDAEGAYYVNKKPVASCGARTIGSDAAPDCRAEMQRILQAAQMMAQRRLGNVVGRGSPRNASCACDRQETTDIFQLVLVAHDCPRIGTVGSLLHSILELTRTYNPYQQ